MDDLTNLFSGKVDAYRTFSKELRWEFERLSGDAGNYDIAQWHAVFQAPSFFLYYLMSLLLYTFTSRELLDPGHID